MPEDTHSNVVSFPTRLRVVSQAPVFSYQQPADLVDHDGRTYRLMDLLAELTPNERQQIEDTAPRTAQAAWDTAVRLWPALADEVAAAVGAVG